VGGVSTFLAQLPENNNKIAPSPKVTYVLPHICKFMHILIHLEDIFKAIFLAIMLLHPKPDVASEEFLLFRRYTYRQNKETLHLKHIPHQEPEGT
jgi:hypothetical protein